MVQPANQFLCGFSLYSGVVFTLAVHLSLSTLCLAWAWVNLIANIPVIHFNFDLGTMIIAAFIALMSLPFILGGILGILEQHETHIRLYLWFCVWTFAIGLVAVTLGTGAFDL